MYKYYTEGVCSSEIDFEIEDGRVKNVVFIDGCDGNLQAISSLVEGMPVEEVINKLRGIMCRNGTSCADQLARALKDAGRAYDSKDTQIGIKAGLFPAKVKNTGKESNSVI